MRLVMFVVFASIGLFAESAWADTVEGASAGDSYFFDEELLDGTTLWGHVPEIRVRPERGSIRLIRPRTTFVPELLKTVERI